jgi:hypothetical protein
LAAAIEARNERRRNIEAATRALEQATAGVSEAKRKLEAAETAVEGAKIAEARHLTDVAAGRGGTPPQTIRQAKDALEDAQDDLAAREAAQTALTTELANLERHSELPELRVREAAVAVPGLSPAIPPPLDDLRKLQHQLYDRGAELRYLVRCGAVSVAPLDTGDLHRPATNPFKPADMLFSAAPVGWPHLNVLNHPVEGGRLGKRR